MEAILLGVEMNSSFNDAKFRKELISQKVSVAILVIEDKSDLKGVVSVIRDLKINSICSDENRLNDEIAFAIGVKGNKPKLFVNLRIAKLEGSDYSGKLLTLCRQIK